MNRINDCKKRYFTQNTHGTFNENGFLMRN